MNPSTIFKVGSRPQPTTKSQLYDLHNLGKGEKRRMRKTVFRICVVYNSGAAG